MIRARADCDICFGHVVPLELSLIESGFGGHVGAAAVLSLGSIRSTLRRAIFWVAYKASTVGTSLGLKQWKRGFGC